MEKRIALRTRKCSRGICWATASTLLPLLLSREDDRPYQRDQEHERGDLERDRPLPEERVADRLERDRRDLTCGVARPVARRHRRDEQAGEEQRGDGGHWPLRADHRLRQVARAREHEGEEEEHR